MRLLVLIPCFNEEHSIGPLVDKVKRHKIDILVIDDGSTDRSAEILKRKKVNVISFKENQGKGAALNIGFAYALKNKYDAVITLDSDGQHNPDEIPNFIKKMDTADIIVGNRMNDLARMPLARRLVNKLLSNIVSWLSRQNIPDSQCGYRLIKVPLLSQLSIEDKGFFAETELLIKASRRGYKIADIPIETIYRNESSHINPFKDTIRFIVKLIGSIRT